MTYNNGNLFSTGFDSLDDPDADGWTNEQEAAAGTDPFDPNPPNGFLRPQIELIPEFWADLNNDNVLELVPASIRITWPTIQGKLYTLLCSPDLAEWLSVQDWTFIGDDTEAEYIITLPQDDKLFWRVKVEDVDSDGDGLTNAEEHELGTDPGLADSDSDGLNDLDEILQGTDPNNADTDGDGSSDGDEVKSGHDSNSSQSYPPTWVYTIRQSFHGLSYIRSSSNWDNYYCVNHSWDPLNSSPETCANLLAADCPFPIQPPDNNSHFSYDNGYAPHLVEGSGIRPHPGSSTELTQSRFWLKTKPAPEADMKSKVLRVTQRKIRGANYSVTMLPPVIEPLDVIIRAGEIFSDPIDALPTFTQTLQEDEREIVVTSIVPIDIDDNTSATGVDDMSVTAATTDTGYQEKFWIMAPSGNDPNGAPCSNALKFRIPFNPALEMEISYPQGTPAPATPTPVTITLAAADAECAWHGESDTTTETPAANWKIGFPGQTKTAVDLPIAVMTMKRRTVKVAVWPVRRSSQNPIFPNEPDRSAYEEDLKTRLNRIFAFQTNAWFDVLVKDDKCSDYVDGTLATSGTPCTLRHGIKEKAMIDASRAGDMDINVYLINNVAYYTGDPVDPSSKIIAGSSYPWNWPDSASYENCVVVNKDLFYTANSDSLHSIAHEIGHLLVGPGHPNQYLATIEGSGGVAPMQHLTMKDHEKRLMFNPGKSDGSSILLVKSEWDEAEKWLVEYPDRRESEQ